MNDAIEKLLQPVSDTEPCGPDLSYDPAFDELQTLLKGKPEVEIGEMKKPAEPPDWAQLSHKSIEFLERSKHLEVAVMLCCGLFRTEGWSGFADGLQLIRRLLEQYWEQVHPLLDPEDNNDPTLRLNKLGALTAPRGAAAGAGSWLRFVDYVYDTPVCRPPGMPPITLGQIQAAAQPVEVAEGAPPAGPDAATLSAAMRDASEQVAACAERVAAAIEEVRGIDALLTNTLGAGGSISFDVIETALGQLRDTLSGQMPAGEETGAVTDTGEAVGGSGAAAPAGSAGIQVSGTIRSRADVIRVLESVCDYYRQVEPGSPVPYLLRRAQKLAGMSFVQAVAELNVGNADTMRPSLGSSVDAESASGDSSS